MDAGGGNEPDKVKDVEKAYPRTKICRKDYRKEVKIGKVWG